MVFFIIRIFGTTNVSVDKSHGIEMFRESLQSLFLRSLRRISSLERRRCIGGVAHGTLPC